MVWLSQKQFYSRFLFVVTFCFLVLSGTALQAQEGDTSAPGYAEGLSLWEANCTSCHKVDAKLIGPALRGVSAKYDREWLYSWIKNSQKLVKSGDPQAVAIFNEYNKSVMTAFPMLKNEQIDNILTYIDNAPKAVATAGAAGGEEIDPCGTPEEAAGFLTPPKEWTPQNLFLLVLTIALLLISFLTGKVVRSLDNVVREREGLEPVRPMTFARMLGSRAFKVVGGLALFILLANTTIDETNSLGYQKGYAPEQPIKFSHKLHACQYEIDCQYCHSGASKGKSAVIPSTNVCMNCHKGISEGPTYGKDEIAKIYEAVGWDPEEQKYTGEEGDPIEWVRIHNLPDHVYFNHSQHVVAGGVECQTCHGEIQTMEVVKQENTLGMGWCIDCHRETEVQFSNNSYYDIYHEFHEDIKAGKRTSVTVEDIGGTECQKCHY